MQAPARSLDHKPRLLAPPIRSWEALESELAAIGVHPHCWPLPLTLLAVREAEKNPIAQPVPQLPAMKRGGEGEGSVSGEGACLLFVRRGCQPLPLKHGSPVAPRPCTHARPPPLLLARRAGSPRARIQLRGRHGPGAHGGVRAVEAGRGRANRRHQQGQHMWVLVGPPLARCLPAASPPPPPILWHRRLVLLACLAPLLPRP